MEVGPQVEPGTRDLIPRDIPLRVVFMGTPEFAVPSLRALLDRPDLATVLAVYTQPDRPAGRGNKLTVPPVKALAVSRGVDVYQVENINRGDEPKKLAAFMADIVVVVAFAQFLGKNILNTPRLGCLNVHSSLLPRWRGAAPIHYALWKGDRVTGVTTMKLVAQMDAGPILLQRSLEIQPHHTGGSLHDDLSVIGAELLVETLTRLRKGDLPEIPQKEDEVTFATLLDRSMGELQPSVQPLELERQVRAFSPWPGTRVTTKSGVLKVLKAAVPRESFDFGPGKVPGTVFWVNQRLFFRTSTGSLEFLEVQQEGKRPISATDFINGQGTREGEL